MKERSHMYLKSILATALVAFLTCASFSQIDPGTILGTFVPPLAAGAPGEPCACLPLWDAVAGGTWNALLQDDQTGDWVVAGTVDFTETGGWSTDLSSGTIVENVDVSIGVGCGTALTLQSVDGWTITLKCVAGRWQFTTSNGTWGILERP